MSIDKKLVPARCLDCAKLNTSDAHGKCELCLNLGFQEKILCDLNRCIQERPMFECSAFQTALRLVGSSGTQADESDVASSVLVKKKIIPELLVSDKIKYERALALQRLGRNPDVVYLQLKYHLVWNVSLRKSVFKPSDTFIDFVSDTFLGCSEIVGGFVKLLYLAPDHVHLFMESDGEISVEEAVNKIKRFSNNAIMGEFSFVKEKIEKDGEIWDETYFVETIG